MNSPYQEEPLFDPVIKTLTPICVFGMLASLTYFMIDLRAAIMPEGVGFMKYILFFFILAAVGLNRIRTEQEEHGCSWVVLSVALALVTLSVLTARAGTMGAFTGQRMGVPLALLINVVIVATIWFGADRITADCSLDGWSEESVAEGLFTTDGAGGRRRRRGVRRPGLLIVMLALPAAVFFGLSRLLLPYASAEVRLHAWASAGAYVFFSLVLLALTSARLQHIYLTSRQVSVPRKAMAVWIAAGIVIAALSLGGARIFPKPNLTAMLTARSAPEVSAEGKSVPFRPGAGTREARPGKGEDLSDAGERGEIPGEEAEGGKKEGGPEEEGEKGQEGAGEKAEKGGPGGENGDGKGAGKGGRTERAPMAPQMGRVLQSLGEIGKKLLAVLIILALLAAVVLFLFPRVAKALRNLGAWRSWWRRLLARFGRKAKAARPIRAPPRRFLNPFRVSRLLKRMSPGELARYTYEALLSYADHQGYPRLPQETPYEFARRLSDSGAKMAPLASSAAETYVLAEYAARELPASALDELRGIWKGLEAYAP